MLSLPLASPEDMNIPRCVASGDEAIAALREHHDRWLRAQADGGRHLQLSPRTSFSLAARRSRSAASSSARADGSAACGMQGRHDMSEHAPLAPSGSNCGTAGACGCGKSVPPTGTRCGRHSTGSPASRATRASCPPSASCRHGCWSARCTGRRTRSGARRGDRRAGRPRHRGRGALLRQADGESCEFAVTVAAAGRGRAGLTADARADPGRPRTGAQAHGGFVLAENTAAHPRPPAGLHRQRRSGDAMVKIVRLDLAP